jgi:hypothetical protein
VTPNATLEAAGTHSPHLSWQAGDAMHVGLLLPGEPARRGLFDPLQGTAPPGMRSGRCEKRRASYPSCGHTPLPLSPHPFSEQKVFRGFISDIVAEKNQKSEKLLTDKTGRLNETVVKTPGLSSSGLME